MKNNFSKKVISIVVIIAFFSIVCFPVPPAQVENPQHRKTEKQEKEKKPGEKAIDQQTKSEIETEAETEINEFYSRDDANVIEDQGNRGVKKRKFPWLLVVGGIVVIGVVLYFTVFKTKKYILAVNVGEGVTGNPITGTQEIKKGKTVSYSYSLQTGYTQLTVTLDGNPVSPSGMIKMNADHTLAASSIKMGSLKINSTPSGAMVYLNGENTGKKTNCVIKNLDAGDYTIKLTKNGYWDYTTTATVQNGKQTSVNAPLQKVVLTGTYEGTTNQNYPVTLKVSKVYGEDTLTYYQIKIKSDVLKGYYVIVTVTHHAPAAPITNYHFEDKGTYVDLTGDFAPDGSVSGTWKLHVYYSGYGTFRGNGTYKANKTATTSSGIQSRLKPGKVKITVEIFKDGRLIRKIRD